MSSSFWWQYLRGGSSRAVVLGEAAGRHLVRQGRGEGLGDGLGDGKREWDGGGWGLGFPRFSLGFFFFFWSHTSADVMLTCPCHVASCGWQAGQYGAVGCGCGYLGQGVANGIIKLKR